MASTQMWTSKLGKEYAKHVIESLDQEHHQVLKALRKLDKNSRCAECAAADTCWASVSLGVFLCVRCSDVHRAVGTHISKVKGCSGTYLWGPDEIARMRETGNARAEELYGHRHRPLPESASKEERVKACEFKYGQGPAAAAPAAAPAPPHPAPCAAGHSAAAGGAAAADGPRALRPAPCAAEGPSAPAAARAGRAAAPPPRRAAGPPRARAAALEAPGVDELFRSIEALGAEAAGGGAAARRAPSPGRPAAPPAAVAAAGLDAFLDRCLLQDGKPAPEPARVAPARAGGLAAEEDFFSIWL